MYIAQIELRNIRCLERLSIDLRSRAATNDSIVLLGDNAVGKSTVLKSIAIGLADPSGAAGLLSDMYGGLVTEGKSEGSIDIVLQRGRSEYRLSTKIRRSKHSDDVEELHKGYPRGFRLDDIFVCGYGPNRASQGTNPYEEYSIADAVYTLFNYEWELQNPELVLRRRGWDDRDRLKLILRQLAAILMVRQSDLRFTRTGLKLQGPTAAPISLGALADGHRSTLSWLLDMIGWAHLASPRATNQRGIVLIDELEQHLHPKWQRHIIKLLSEQFPWIQFVATSHSAMCAAGVYEYKSRLTRIGQAHVLRKERDSVVHEALPPIDGWKYSEILESHAFDNTPPHPEPLKLALDKVRKLYRRDGRESPSVRRAVDELRELSASHGTIEQERLNQLRHERELADLRRAFREKQ